MIEYKSGYKYQLNKTCVLETKVCPPRDIDTELVSLDRRGNLAIRRGYCWDGCSGPTWDSKSTMRAGLAHDALYQLMRMDLLSATWRAQADEELRRLALEDGMWGLRAWYFYKAVRKFGLSSASAENRKKLHTAP